MKISNVIDYLNSLAKVGEITADTVKYGDTGKDVQKIAVTMFATPSVIRRAAEWGADLIVTHEPTYHTKSDVPGIDPVDIAKHKLIEDTGAVIYRYHDHMHLHEPDDLISKGVLLGLGLEGELVKSEYYASSIFTPKEPVSADELCVHCNKILGTKHIRVAGDGSFKGKKIAACFGSPAGVFELLYTDDIDIVMVGEACEWKLCEYARDAAELGIKKAVVAMGHEPSERFGMYYLAEIIKEAFSNIEVKCFDSGEVYN